MAVDFPNTPTVGQLFTSGGVAFLWDGAKWVAQSSATAYGTGVPIWLTVGDAAPPSPQPGAVWFDSVGMQSYLYFQDPDSIEWVPLSNQGSPIGNAASLQNVGRNYVHNSKFNICQRTGPWSYPGAAAYNLDRWAAGVGGSDTLTITQVGLGDADRAGIGDESAINSLQATFVGSSVAAASTNISHWIEDVHRLSGKTVTVSFWAGAGSGTLNVGVQLEQYFGGGSSSPAWIGNGQSVAVPTGWRRYSVTLTFPSAAGKTTDNTSCSGLVFWFSAGANYAAQSGSVGVQSGTVWLWGVQLELGTTASQFQNISPEDDLRQCQRFYSTGNYSLLFAVPQGNAYCGAIVQFPVVMRITPSVTPLTPFTSNVNNLNIDSLCTTSARFYTTGVNPGYYAEYSGTWVASADL